MPQRWEIEGLVGARRRRRFHNSPDHCRRTIGGNEIGGLRIWIGHASTLVCTGRGHRQPAAPTTTYILFLAGSSRAVLSVPLMLCLSMLKKARHASAHTSNGDTDRPSHQQKLPCAKKVKVGDGEMERFRVFVPSSPRAPGQQPNLRCPTASRPSGMASVGRISRPGLLAHNCCDDSLFPFSLYLPPSPDTVPFLKMRGRATSSLLSTNKSQVKSSHFPTTSCQNIWFSRRFPSILVHQELGASWWLVPASTAQHSDKGTPPLPMVVSGT